MTAMYEVESMCRAEAWVKANLVPLVYKQRSSVSVPVCPRFLASENIKVAVAGQPRRRHSRGETVSQLSINIVLFMHVW